MALPSPSPTASASCGGTSAAPPAEAHPGEDVRRSVSSRGGGGGADTLDHPGLREGPAAAASVFSRGSDEDEEEEEEDGEEEGESWIFWFCALDGHECFAEVDEDYIKDSFNLFGLKPLISNYDAALDMILGPAPDEEDIDDQHFLEVYRDAMDLYGLIHARYIITPRGLAQMREKYVVGQFGECPRVLCDRHPVLPLGISPDLLSHRLRLYCPLCQEAYEVRDGTKEAKDIDGAFFGPSFPHIFLQTFVNLVPLDVPVAYEPKIFGFRVHNRKSIVQLKLERGEFGADCVTPQPHYSHAPESVGTVPVALDASRSAHGTVKGSGEKKPEESGGSGLKAAVVGSGTGSSWKKS